MNEFIEKAMGYYASKDYRKALDLFEKDENQSIILRSFRTKNNYLWTIWHVVLKQDFIVWKEDYDKIQKYVKIIHNNSLNKDLIFVVTVFRMIDYFNSFTSIDMGKIEQWIDLLDVDNLSTDLMEPKKINGRMVQLASNKEKWFMIKSKCCEELEKYHECLRISRKAQKDLEVFCFNNDIWFRRREGISLLKLGEYDEALKIFEEILLIRKDSFHYTDLANAQYQKGLLEEAKKNYVLGLKKQKKIEFCMPALKTLSDIYLKEGRKDISDILIRIIIITRKENDWVLRGDENDYVFDENFSSRYPSDNDIKSAYYKTISELSSDKSKKISDTYSSGYVKTMLENGKSGFVSTSKGESIYFNVNEIQEQVPVDLLNKRVSFQVAESFDRKKQRMSKIAVDIWFEK